ncbi:MAG: glycosyltransferase, partial [Bifidobacteriaceae bacterium]|nr:glycosyltransferase [Bifidobacteriaceae bacterium]
MSQPVVSIIVPVYNAEKGIRRCVDSILGQEFTDFELLLVDDGSTDGSPAILDAYAAAD